MEEYEQIKALEFEKHIRELIISNENNKKRINRLTAKYDQIFLAAGKPIETLLTEFLENCKNFDEEHTVQMAVYMGKVFQLSISDHEGHLDRFGHKLYESHLF